MKKSIISIVSVISIFIAQASFAQTAGGEYNSGKGCYRQLLRSGSKSDSSSWRKCMAFFEEYYANHPDSAKASSSLYSAGRLRQEHYSLRGDKADLDGAIKDYNQLVRNFPKSSLADDSLYRIGCLRQDSMDQTDRAKRAFNHIVETYPSGDMAVHAKARLAKLGPATETVESAPVSETDAATEPATAQTETVTETAAASEVSAAQSETVVATQTPAVVDAPKSIEETSEETTTVTADAIVEDEVAAVGSTQGVNASSGSMADAFNRATLSDVVVRGSGGGATINLVLDREVEHSVQFTDSGPRTGSPAELDVILLHTKPSKGLLRERYLESDYVDLYKVKRLILSSGIKVSFKLKNNAGYDVKKTGNGLAINIGTANVASAAPSARITKPTESRGTSNLTDFRIVIDPGHGGDEDGAIGPKGTKEKDVTLAIAKRLAKELTDSVGTKVYLTRSDDRTMTLEERNAIAVKKKADLFISIHANASRDKDASGVETYYLNNATDAAAKRLAARENKYTRKKLSEVEHIISTMLQNYDTAESAGLAKQVQGKLAKKLNSSHGHVRDRGVRSALFYVLVGAKCPAILVETAFISNPKEEKLLKNRKYQRNVADAIADGVKGYMKVRDKELVSL